MSKLDLTPVDIRHQEFSSQLMGGYNKREVKEFLELISSQLEESKIKQTAGIKPSAKDTEKATDPAPREKQDFKPYQEIEKQNIRDNKEREDLIGKALIAAEKTKAEILRNAQKEAEYIIRKAQSEAEKSIEEAGHFIKVLEHEYLDIKEQKKQFLVNLKSELETLLDRINRDNALNDSHEKEMDKKLKIIGDIQKNYHNKEKDSDKTEERNKEEENHVAENTSNNKVS